MAVWSKRALSPLTRLVFPVFPYFFASYRKHEANTARGAGECEAFGRFVTLLTMAFFLGVRRVGKKCWQGAGCRPYCLLRLSRQLVFKMMDARIARNLSCTSTGTGLPPRMLCLFLEMSCRGTDMAVTCN